ncbi:hypothetical protein COT62_03330 [Candidatus Roizmanbacteria bacterium CG09_land_8_20_14_0_10_41_9]|uniref:PD-(D/E)XK endonuclease-like domain-containing protein n=1 Tax=Candidatus Roizmanbacteria bacterium CG09_land_8_20_14_0_10_41_9 TaxID=1974850 RepID=A0A2H0WU92_9BACT|nr:MAG: hypothetical protein COT62_03330 [Candidatus Roizmanbacteria bacterium CG09_land_8_20_14_0_10_41_9]
MAQDKYTAVWVSHTSIGDFISCPRAYYLKHIYRTPKTGHKIKLMSPPLALGQAVHEVIESLSVLPVDQRFKVSLIERLHKVWEKVKGKKGGFISDESEISYRSRAEAMLRRVMENPGPVGKQAIKIKMDLPFFWLSPEDNIILCGKIDWLEYLSETDSVRIVDFKTSRNEESPESLQLPIYHLLVHNCQKRPVDGMSYWYLERSDTLTERPLPNLEKAHAHILEIAKKIKVARKLNVLKCPHGGCRACRPFEAILQGEAELVGVDEYKSDIYVLDKSLEGQKKDSVVL